MRQCPVLLALMLSSISGLAADGAIAGIISTQGKVTVDGNLVGPTSPVSAGDVIETSLDSLANLTITGSTLIIHEETLVRFDGHDIYLDHGAITVGSATSLQIHVKCITAIPSSNEWTQFDVASLNSTVQVVDRKNAVNISTGTPFDLVKTGAKIAASTQSKPMAGLKEGQQYNGHESVGCPDSGKKGAPPSAVSSILNSPYMTYVGAGVIGGVTAWVILQSPGPISPAAP